MLLRRTILPNYELRATPPDRSAYSEALSPAKVRQRFPYERTEKGYPSLRFAEFSLKAFGIADSWPGKDASSLDQDALVLDMGRSVVHSVVGLIETQRRKLVADTLVQTSPARDGYRYTTSGDVLVTEVFPVTNCVGIHTNESTS